MMGCSIIPGPVPGMLHRVVDTHDAHYASCWGFGPAFTPKNLSELSAFLKGFDPQRCGIQARSGADRNAVGY